MAAAQRLAAVDVDAVITSPRARARATADAIANALGIEAVVDEAIAETDFGDWEGHTFAEIRAQWPDELTAWLADPDVAPPGGESFTATFKRVSDWRERAVVDYPGKTVVVVSHVTPIKTLVAHAMGAPLEAVFRMELSPASISVVSFHDDPRSDEGPRGSLRLYNTLPPGNGATLDPGRW